MTEVFISYTKEDVDRVRLIAEALAQAGYEVWWDHRIPPGRTYREVIGAALQTAKCVIVVWSQKSIESQWVLDEADAGQQRRVLLPILIDNVMPPYGFGQIEAARLINWTGDTGQIEWQHTVDAVARLVGREPGAAPPVSISMPSGGGRLGESPAVTLATPGAALENRDRNAAASKKGGMAGLLIGVAAAVLIVGGGAYYAIANNLFSGSTGSGVIVIEEPSEPALQPQTGPGPAPDTPPSQPEPEPQPEPQAQPEPQGHFPGINGENVMSVDWNGERLQHVRDGFWITIGENGLPEQTYQETGRDEWSVYLHDVHNDRDIALDLHLRQAKQGGENGYQPVGEIVSASALNGSAPRIADYRAFMFGPELRFERLGAGPPETWVEVNAQTGQRGAVWTKVYEDQHFMELTDDGRGARMRVDLIQKQVYLFFPDWGQFNPQWPVTDALWR